MNITDFWRRWHLTLSAWLRDYLFTPLSLKFRNFGKLSGLCLLLSLHLSFVVSGMGPKLLLSFGVGCTVLRWHGIYLQTKSGSKLKKKNKHRAYIGSSAYFITFHFLCFTFVIFRAADIATAIKIYEKIFTTVDFSLAGQWINLYMLPFIILILGVLLHYTPIKWNTSLLSLYTRMHWTLKRHRALHCFYCHLPVVQFSVATLHLSRILVVMNNPLIQNGQYNIGHICTAQQCAAGFADKVAMRWIGSELQRTDYTFNNLNRESNRFANVLERLGFHKGDIFFSFLPRTTEQIFSFLGTLKIQAVAGTLFSNFGEESLLDRLGDSNAKGIITKKSLYKKIARIREKLPSLKTIIVIDSDEHISEDVLSYSRLMNEASDQYTAAITSAETPALLQYTSGSVGKPKGAMHVHKSVLLQQSTSKNILQLNENEIYWCSAEPSWITGIAYGIIGPWSLGVTQIHFGGSYNAEQWMTLLEKEKISVWYTSPTALRMLMREEVLNVKSLDLGALKYIFSVGEYLNPEIIPWVKNNFGKDVYETYFQTETGSIMISSRPGWIVKPGSMGKANDKIEAFIISDNAEILADRETGNLCFKAGWDSMFSTYLNNEDVYNKKFKNGYYYTNDLAYRDADGYFWWKGRNDDVINTAGHLINPMEIESSMQAIPEIAETGVIGAPDDILLEKVVAYIKLKDGCEWTDELELNIRLRIANKLSTIATPQEIKVVKEIPKKENGDVDRRLLKEWYKRNKS